MIDEALEVLTNSIQDYLKHLPELNITSEKKIELTHIIKYDGTIAIPNNSLGLSLVSIEEERVIKSQQAFTTTPKGQVTHINPELKLNLYILITAHFTDYKAGLKFLSGAIRFFQSKNVFTSENSPGLDPRIEKLIVELYSLNLEQQHHLWGLLGAKYLPSVMYRVRMLTIQEAQAKDEQEALKIINIYKLNI